MKIDGRTVAGSFASTETVTAEILANPVGNAEDPTSWTGTATLNFGPIVNTGLPQGCELTTAPPTGTTQVAITKQGDDINVVWSTNVNPLTPSVRFCRGIRHRSPERRLSSPRRSWNPRSSLCQPLVIPRMFTVS